MGIFEIHDTHSASSQISMMKHLLNRALSVQTSKNYPKRRWKCEKMASTKKCGNGSRASTRSRRDNRNMQRNGTRGPADIRVLRNGGQCRGTAQYGRRKRARHGSAADMRDTRWRTASARDRSVPRGPGNQRGVRIWRCYEALGVDAYQNSFVDRDS